MNRRAAETRGRKAEGRAALWLRLFGWRPDDDDDLAFGLCACVALRQLA